MRLVRTLSSAALAIAAAVATYMALSRVEPLYTADASILIEERESPLTRPRTAETARSADFDESAILSQVEVVRSRFWLVAAFVIPLTLFFIGTRLWALGKRHGFMTPVQLFRDRWECGHIGTVISWPRIASRPLIMCWVSPATWAWRKRRGISTTSRRPTSSDACGGWWPRRWAAWR